MPNPGKGELLRTKDGLVVRLTIEGKERECYPLAGYSSEAEVEAKRELLADIAKRFRKAGVIRSPKAQRVLHMAASQSAAVLKGALPPAVAEVLGSPYRAPNAKRKPTFEEFATEWTSGELAKRFPDQVDTIIQDMNVLRFKKVIFPAIGSIPIDEVTREHCDEVMRKLPVPKGKKELSRTTRRQYAGLLNRVLNLAELAGHIDRNPLPRKWLPKPAPSKRFPILYPREDAILLTCPDVPLADRILYGFLHREAMRRGEAAALQWKDLDLENGTIALDENKTDHPRWWKLSPGVTKVLKRWKEVRKAGGEDLVFVAENGGPVDLDHMADRVRRHLRAAGLTRADLYSTGPLKGAFGTHSFRRSFVTRSLALGLSDDYARQRTGHTTDELLGYRQAAKALAELELGDVDPLDQLIDVASLEGPVMAQEMVGAGRFELPTPRPPV